MPSVNRARAHIPTAVARRLMVGGLTVSLLMPGLSGLIQFGAVHPEVRLASSSPAVQFGPPINPPVLEPLAIAVGDLRGNGKRDIVTSYFGVQVQLGNGDGTFGPYTSYAADGATTAIAIADVNGDGKPDIITANDSSDVSVLLGNGDGSFQAPRNVPLPAGANSVAVADLIGNGKQDLVVGMSGISKIGVLMGNGDGTFGPATTYATHGGVGQVAIADMNGDGKPDIVAADGPPPGADHATVGIFLNSGGGIYAAESTYNIGNTYAIAHSVALADFNGDGLPDVVVGNQNCGYNGGDTVVLLNQGGGSLGTAISLGDGCTDSVTVADINGDGIPDVISSNPQGFYNNTDQVRVMLTNLGGTTFQPPVAFTVRSHPRGIAVGDFNRDGRPDIATANFDNCTSCHPTSTVSVLLNQTQFPPAGGSLSAQEMYGGGSPSEPRSCPCHGHRADPVDRATSPRH